MLWLDKAARSGSALAMHRLSRMYRDGEGVDKDPTMAREWIEKAQAQGHHPATVQVAYAHLNGAMGYPKDYAQARALFQQALDAGHEQARSGLAAVDRAEAAEKAAAERAAAAEAQQAKPAAQ